MLVVLLYSAIDSHDFLDAFLGAIPGIWGYSFKTAYSVVG